MTEANWSFVHSRSHVRQRVRLRLNADKGLKAEGGRDAVVLGTIANPDLEMVDYFRAFALHELGTADAARPLTGTTDGDGTLWLFMGTDSGYAGFTAQSYDQLDVTLTPQWPGIEETPAG